jgi:MFS transporter, CP family, cyanate transporter
MQASPPGDLHRVTAGLFNISYSCTVVVPIVSGGQLNPSGRPAIAFVPVGIGMLGLIGLAPSIALGEKAH